MVGTLVYGKVMYYSLVDEAKDENVRSLEPVASRSPEDRRLLLWLTMLGFTISGGVSLPVIGGLALGLQNSHAGISSLGLFGAVLLGVFTISASVLLRVGNGRNGWAWGERTVLCVAGPRASGAGMARGDVAAL